MSRRTLLAFGISFGLFLLMFFIFMRIAELFTKPQTITLDGVSIPLEVFPSPSVSPSPTPVPTIAPGLTPVTLLIPKLKIQAPIELVGLTPTNNMDVPKKAENAAWYMYGSRPSEEGNAVIAAHYDTPTGRPALFYNLKKLEPGDEIVVISENAVRSVFTVTEKASIPYDKFPNEEVFISKPGKNLNLITCGGIWDARKKTYLERLVVYTTYKDDKTI